MLIFSFQYSTAQLSELLCGLNQTTIITILKWVFLSTLKCFRKKGKAWISGEQCHLWRVSWTGSLCFPELLDGQALLPSPSRESLCVGRAGFKPGLKHTLQGAEDQEGELLSWKGHSSVPADGINFGQEWCEPWASRELWCLWVPAASQSWHISCNCIPEIPNDGEDCISNQNWTRASSSGVEIPLSATAQSLALLPHLQALLAPQTCPSFLSSSGSSPCPRAALSFSFLLT